MHMSRKVHHNIPGQLNCAICHEPVDLKTAKTDGDGNGVHEECYLRKMVRQKGEPEVVGHRSWSEIATDVLKEKDPQRFQELAGELDEALAAQELSSKWQSHRPEKNLHQLPRISQCERIVDAAVSVMRSDYASLQMLFPERGTGGELRLLAFRGFNPEAAKFWEWVRADSKSTCLENCLARISTALLPQTKNHDILVSISAFVGKRT